MMLGRELVSLGHSVIIITHRYGKYNGKFKIHGMLVYYLDLPVICSKTTLPTLFCTYPLYKSIFLYHNIDIVHGHQSMSTMGMESIYHAQQLGISTILTDHSMFEFLKIERIICNTLNQFICQHIDHIICVSKSASINTAKRLNKSINDISIIPNGIDTKLFYPNINQNNKRIRVLFCARLVFRKGIDLLASALPLICKSKNIEIFVVGDGPMKNIVEQVIDEHELYEQVKLKDTHKLKDIPELLRSCDIFLNTSLTETFCMAILEASACGLAVVTTNVGGVSEVLDSRYVYYCKATAQDIADQVNKAAKELKEMNKERNYNKLVKKYDWKRIAKRNEKVYLEVINRKRDKRIENKGLVFGFIRWFTDLQRKVIDLIFGY